MANFNLPYFGRIDPSLLEEYYEVDIPHNAS